MKRLTVTIMDGKSSRIVSQKVPLSVVTQRELFSYMVLVAVVQALGNYDPLTEEFAVSVFNERG